LLEKEGLLLDHRIDRTPKEFIFDAHEHLHPKNIGEPSHGGVHEGQDVGVLANRFEFIELNIEGAKWSSFNGRQYWYQRERVVWYVNRTHHAPHVELSPSQTNHLPGITEGAQCTGIGTDGEEEKVVGEVDEIAFLRRIERSIENHTLRGTHEGKD